MNTTATVDAPSSVRPLTARDARFWVVPHTHWDREWYLPFEQFRMMLVRTVDELLDVLEAIPELTFTLDGQTIVIEDYLAIRPAHADRLRRLIADGRIAIGPCYILPDPFLVGAESHVRNLLAGRYDCERMGARPMLAGYVPDAFGHIAQFPQILRGFGIDNMLFGRGMGDEWDRLRMAFEWRAPDGTGILALPLPDSYGNACMLGEYVVDERGEWRLRTEHDDPMDVATHHVETLMRRYGERYAATELRDVVLCNGVDHLPVQSNLLEVLDAVRARIPGATFTVTTYEGYVDVVREWARDRTLPVFAGELLGGLEQNVLRAVNSTRVYLKQENERIETGIMVAETLAVLAHLALGASELAPLAGPDKRNWVTERFEPGLRFHPPRAELWFAWRELMRNHPHDSICGCSVDEVHREMLHRFASVDQIVTRLRREAMSALAGIDEPWSYRESPSPTQSVANPLCWRRRQAVALVLPDALRTARSIAAEVDGAVIPSQVVDENGERCALVELTIDGFGAAQVQLRRPRRADVQTGDTVTAGDRWLESPTMRVEVHDDGSIDVTDRTTGRSWSGLNVFEDVGDRGDEYNFDAIPNERPWTSVGTNAKVTTVEFGPVRAAIRIELTASLPASLTARRDARAKRTVPIRVTTTVSLTAGSDRIAFETSIDNRARDHRLRVLVPTSSRSPSVDVEQHFAVGERPLVREASARWKEPPQPTEHTLGFVATDDLVVLTRGTPEYQALRAGDGAVTIALTLLRCIEWLSRGDLVSRPAGHAGPELHTPEAQCIGQHRFAYAIAPRRDARAGKLMRMSQDYRTNLATGPGGAVLDDVLRVEGDDVVHTALKFSEHDSGATVLRLSNPGPTPASVRVTGTFRTLHPIRLDETVDDPRIFVDTDGAVRIPPFAIATLRLHS